MIIDLFDGEPEEGDYRIRTAPLNVILEKRLIRHNKKEGTFNAAWAEPRHFGSIRQCIEWAAQDIAWHPQVQGLKDYYAKSDKLLSTAIAKVKEKI